MKLRFKPFLFLLILIFWRSSVSFAVQEKAPALYPYSEALKKFERFVEEQMCFDQTPGLSVGFFKDDFSWTSAFGFADLENRVPARPVSSYRMASITKTFTAFAVLQLVEKGKMDLDAEIQTYVPYFPRKKWPVTVRHLLGHLGGIPHYVDLDKELHIKEHKNTREALAIFQDYELISEPGTQYHYSSYGYNLLGAAIEGASGQPYGDYIKEHIFDPLGMTDSRMDDPLAIIPNRVKGYRLLNGRVVHSEFMDNSSRFASGGTRSTIVDLLKYARGIIQKKLVGAESWRHMLEPLATKAGLLTGKGMGWNVRPLRGHYQIYHGGSQAETKTYLMILPLENMAIALASNFENFDRELYAYKLAECVLEEDVNTPVYCSDAQEQLLYSACEQAFSYGLSQYDWHRRPLARSERDLEEAFFFFNQNVDPAALRRNPESARNNLLSGIHPAAGQAFTKVGSFMASELERAYGRERLRDYPKEGPLAFFSDYVDLLRAKYATLKDFTFSARFTELLSRWKNNWARAWTNETRLLILSFNTDPEELRQKLSQTFSQASLYPDFHQDLIRIAQYHLKRDNTERAFPFLTLAEELYPHRTAAITSLASLHLWTGNVREAERLFKKAYSSDPNHPGVSLDQFQSLARSLIQARKMENLSALAEIVTEIYPRSWKIFQGLGDMFFNLGEKEQAILHYRKALKLNPGLKDVRERVELLEKERK
jgi:CubicO group peptidase (beta-lactamase class C family)/Tfp pilus assembly protein PilF